MGSLQEQLLKAGLVSAEQLEETRKKNKPGGRPGAARRGNKPAGRRGSGAGNGARAAADRGAGGKGKGQSGDRRHGGKNAAAKKSGGGLTLEEAYRLRQQQERQEQNQDKLRQQREQEARRQRNLKLDAIVKDKILNDAAADIRRYFEYGERIRHLYVTQEQLDALAEGKLGIVVLRGRYLLLDAEALAEFQAVAPDLVPDLSKSASGEEGDSADDVPEDLRW